MDLSERLQKLTDDRDNYECTDKTANKGKKVVAILGPTAVGKSMIIKACLSRAFGHKLFSITEAGTSTNRARRPDDPENYHTDIPTDEILTMIEEGKPANWSAHGTGKIYTTLPEDFPAEYNFMACLPDSLPMLRKAGFKAVFAVYVVTTTDDWDKQLHERIIIEDDSGNIKYSADAAGRIEEAIDSLAQGKNDVTFNHVFKTPETLDEAADYILDLIAPKEDSLTSSYNSKTYDMENRYNKNIGEMYSYAVELARQIDEASNK